MPNTVSRRTTGPVEAAPGSPLFDLRKRRTEILAKLHLDLEVPRWSTADGGVWIRYNPVRVTQTVTSVDKRQKAKEADWLVLAAADSLVDSCVGVYLRAGDQRFTLAADGEWTPFNPDTAAASEWVSVKGSRSDELNEAFGFENMTRAVDTLRALFLTDGDLLSHADRLNEFSTAVTPDADEEAVGK